MLRILVHFAALRRPRLTLDDYQHDHFRSRVRNCRPRRSKVRRTTLLFHLDQVVENLSEYGPIAETVGYLHDVVEDTSITVAEIKEKFGPLVAECVALLTDEPGSNRKERKAKTYKKLSAVSGPSELALIVKVADRLANVRACIADKKVGLWNVYRDEHPTFRAAAYRPGQCEALWGQLDSLLQEGTIGTGV